EDTVDLIESVGLGAVRDKAARLGRFVIESVDELLAGHGVRVTSPLDDEQRGGHVTLAHPRLRAAYRGLWAQDVVPDFRAPDGSRLGLAPMRASSSEVAETLVRSEGLLSAG